MSDFSVESELSIVVPRRELRSARQEVEDALADIPVGMSASGGGGGGGTNAAREQRRRRREFRWARQRTDDTEAQLEVLENIEGELTEGGLGGGGDIISSITDLGGEAAGIATDLGTSIVDAVAPGLGALIGTGLGQQVGGGGGGGGTTNKEILSPEVTVEPEVSPEIETTVTPEFNPAFEPKFNPEFNPEINAEFSPEFDPEVNTEISPDFDGELELPDVSFGGGGGGLSEPVDVIVQNTPLPVSGVSGGRGGGGGNGEREIFGPSENLPVVGDFFSDINEAVADFVDQTPLSRLPEVRGSGDSGSGQGGGGAPSNASASAGDVNVTVNADVQPAVQQAVEQVRREQERQRQELRQDLENEIRDLRRQIQGGSQGRGFRR